MTTSVILLSKCALTFEPEGERCLDEHLIKQKESENKNAGIFNVITDEHGLPSNRKLIVHVRICNDHESLIKVNVHS